MRLIRRFLPYLIICFLTLVPVRAGGEQSRTGVGRLTFVEEVHDFGVVIQGQNVKSRFEFKNTGTGNLIIYETQTACGCTAVIASTGPFRPGETGFIEVSYDTRGKIGHAYKDVKVLSNDPLSPATIAIEGTVSSGEHPTMAAGDVLFSGSCAQCHAVPAKGKRGIELYDAACAICHDPPPGSKKVLAGPRDALSQISKKRLKEVISKGIHYTSMPGFSHSSGGPLTKRQIRSLIKYLRSIRSK